MTRDVLALAAFLLLPVLSWADNGYHEHHEVVTEAASSDPPIKITINPEARVSVVLAGALPPPSVCGTSTELPVEVVNQGFVTMPLEAALVGDLPAGVAIDFQSKPLRGLPQELRTLRITLTKPGPTDLTIAFRAHNEISDLGGRDRVHFLLRCLESR